MIHWRIADELVEMLREAGLMRRFRARPAPDDTDEPELIEASTDHQIADQRQETSDLLSDQQLRTDFMRWYANQGFRHFRASELLFEGASHHDPDHPAYGLNGPPQKHLWSNILPTLRLLDQLREDLGRPIRITSAYRSLAYNRAIGSSDASQHRRFRALDFTVAGLPARIAADRLDEWRQAGRWSGGLGRYRTFTHIDTRGRNATWSG